MRLLHTSVAVGFSLFVLVAPPLSAEESWRLDIEGAALWQTRNDFAIPGNTGTRISLDAYSKGPFAAFRATLVWDVSQRNSLRVLAAPLRLDVDFTPTAPIDFQGETFPAGQSARARYEFDSYRLSWFYRFPSSGSWALRAGLTAKLRDARIALASGPRAAEKKNTGFVPLVYAGARYSPAARFSVDLDIDALGAPQGYAVDVAVRAERHVAERASVFLGYRFLDGGADNDEVYTFATFHYAIAGLQLRF